MASFLKELRRRNVFRVGMAYLAITWLLMQVADIVLPAFHVAGWALRTLIIIVAVGFPISLIVAWVYELTPEGLKRTEEVDSDTSIARHTGRKLDFTIIGVLSLALVTVIIDQYILEPPPRPMIASLAVLPLDNLSGDPEQEYFVDGMTEALITSLAKISALRVVSRTSTMQFKDSDKAIPQIASELGVDAVIVGSAIRDGDRIRITAQMIDAESDQHLWAKSYDRDYQDILILQNEIATSVAKEIEISLTPEESTRLAQAPEINPAAYDLYLKGLQHFYALTPHDLETSLQYFTAAIEQYPDFALAYSGVAASWIGLQQMGFVPSSEAAPKIVEASEHALRIDANQAQAYGWLGVIYAWLDWDWVAGEEAFVRAIELNPSAAEARASYSHLLTVLGRFDEAVVQSEVALQVDPFNPWFLANYAVVLHISGRYEDAIEMFHKALRIAPDIPFALVMLAGSNHMTGKFDAAIDAEAKFLLAMEGVDSQQKFLHVYEQSGYAEALGWLGDHYAVQSAKSGSGACWVAMRYARAGQNERAVEMIELGLKQMDPNLPYFRAPEYDNIRPDPRIQQIMRTMNLL